MWLPVALPLLISTAPRKELWWVLSALPARPLSSESGGSCQLFQKHFPHRVGQKRSFRHVLAEQRGSVLPSAPPSPNSARCHAGKFRLVISCPQVDKNTSTVLSCTKLRLIPHDFSSSGSITHFYGWAGSIKLPFNHPQLTELP